MSQNESIHEVAFLVKSAAPEKADNFFYALAEKIAEIAREFDVVMHGDLEIQEVHLENAWQVRRENDSPLCPAANRAIRGIVSK